MNVHHNWRPFSNWSLKPLPGEPAHGFFLRLVANEGHYSARVYADEIGLNGRKVEPGVALDTIISLPISDESKAALKACTPLAEGKYYQISGQRLRTHQMSFTSRRFCPGCLAESAHHRAWWDIVDFHICPIHNQPIESLTETGEKIGWWWSDISTSPDGRMLPRSMPTVISDGKSLEAYILGRLGFLRRTKRPLLDGYHLYEVIEAHQYVERWLGMPFGNKVVEKSHSQTSPLNDALLGTSDDLVSAIRSWFVENVPEDILKSGLTKSLGWALNGCPQQPGTTIGIEIHQATMKAFTPIGRAGRQWTSTTGHVHSERVISEIARDIGVRPSGLNLLARHLGLISRSPAIGERHFLTRDQEARLLSTLDTAISSKAAEEICGCSDGELLHLHKQGFLIRLKSLGPDRRYLEGEIRDLALRRATESAQALVGGELEPNQPGEGTKILDGDCQSEDQDRIGKQQRIASTRNAGRDTTITKAGAGAMLGLEQTTIAMLLQLKLLESGTDGNGGVFGISLTSLNSFHEKYANAHIYAGHLGVSHMAVLDTFLKLDVYPAFGIGGNGHNNFIVERKAARKAMKLDIDPDEMDVAGCALWDEFRNQANTRLPVFVFPKRVDLRRGAHVRSSTRKIAVHCEINRGAGTVKLSFELHRKKSARRWTIFEAEEAAVRSSLYFAKWTKTEDGTGWNVSLTMRSSADLEDGIRMLMGCHKHFK